MMARRIFKCCGFGQRRKKEDPIEDPEKKVERKRWGW